MTGHSSSPPPSYPGSPIEDHDLQAAIALSRQDGTTTIEDKDLQAAIALSHQVNTAPASSHSNPHAERPTSLHQERSLTKSAKSHKRTSHRRTASVSYARGISPHPNKMFNQIPQEEVGDPDLSAKGKLRGRSYIRIEHGSSSNILLLGPTTRWGQAPPVHPMQLRKRPSPVKRLESPRKRHATTPSPTKETMQTSPKTPIAVSCESENEIDPRSYEADSEEKLQRRSRTREALRSHPPSNPSKKSKTVHFDSPVAEVMKPPEGSKL